MNVIRLPSGDLIVPLRAEGPGGIVGDGAITVKPGDPDYEKYNAEAIDEDVAFPSRKKEREDAEKYFQGIRKRYGLPRANNSDTIKSTSA